jgi:cobalamin transport system ATP-binding protein
LIELKNIEVTRGGFNLAIESLQLQKGEMIAVLGNNGSGKSTFFSMLAGFLKFKGGYLLSQTKFKEIAFREKSRLIGLLPQKTELNMPFDVTYIILTGRFSLTNGYQYGKVDHQATESIIEQLELGHLRNRSFKELSGGEKQRVLLARTLNRETPVLLLDEPLNGIDLKHQHETIGLLQGMKKEKAIMVVMHDVSLALREFDRFLIFSEGRLIYISGKEQLSPARLVEIFDVEIDFLEKDGRLYVHTRGRS